MTKLLCYLDNQGNAVFLDSRHRKVFEIRACDDGKSIEVRAVEGTTVMGVNYIGMIDIRPRVDNTVEIRLRNRKDF